MVDNTIRVNIEDMPVPPPWELGEDGRYHNTITDEFIDFHPLRKLFMSNQANEPQVESPLPIMPQLSSIAQTEGVDNTQHISSSSSRSSSMFPSLNPQLESIAAPNSTSKPEFLTKRPKSFADFRCYWKEVGLFGKVNSYTVLIRYYQDCSVDVKFNGIDGIWQYSHLEGPYGVLDRLDMFIGAKINLFGRHLTISSASASLCHEIELEGKRLLKRQDFLRSKIESVAAVVRGITAVPNDSVLRMLWM